MSPKCHVQAGGTRRRQAEVREQCDPLPHMSPPRGVIDGSACADSVTRSGDESEIIVDFGAVALAEEEAGGRRQNRRTNVGLKPIEILGCKRAFTQLKTCSLPPLSR